MKLFYYIAVIGGTVAAVVIMLILLFSPDNASWSAGTNGNDRVDDERIRQLEDRIGRLSNRLSDNERKNSRLKEFGDSGVAPEYFRENVSGSNHDSQLKKEGSSPVSGKTAMHNNDAAKKNSKSEKEKGDKDSLVDNNTDDKSEETEKNYVGGLVGLYYAGRDFNELKLVMTDYEIDFDFGDESPDRLIEDDNFSISWRGIVKADNNTEYTFHTVSDDGVRLWVGGKRIINSWNDHAPKWDSGKVKLTEGYHTIRLDFYERGGGATIKLLWSSDSMSREIISPANLFHDVKQEEKLRGEMR